MNSKTDDFEPIWSLGFMSGTSLDAVDAAMILTDGETILDFGRAEARLYLPEEREILQRATDAARVWDWTGEEPVTAFQAARDVVTKTHIDAGERFVLTLEGPQPEIMGVHGQTVLHRRTQPGIPGATLQLIDAPAISDGLLMPIAYDFRTDDVAAGGQGAPLAPAYHSGLLQKLGDGCSVALNLGGVANITARMSDGSLLAFDTGPANGPIDEWIERHRQGTYDKDGAAAAAGTVDEDLLAHLLQRDWFTEQPPKSLDRYDFNADMVKGLSYEDGAATLTAFSARAVAAGIAQLPEVPQRIIVCGGGRLNPVFMQALREVLPGQLLTAEQAGWRGDSIEAEAFAFLAVRTLRGLPLSWPTTTGVPAPQTGGKLLMPDFMVEPP